MSATPENSDVEEPVFPDSPLFCNLDAHRAMLQAIADHSPADIYLKDLDGKYLLVNRNFGHRVGLEPDLVLGKTVYHCFTKSEADQKSANDETVVREGRARQFEEVVTMEDGEHTLLSEKFPIRDENGKIYAVCGISTDITFRKADEEKLLQLSSRVQQQGRTLETVLSASPGIVYMFDGQGRFLYANMPGATNFGVRPVDIIGKTWKSLNLPEGVFEPFMVHITQVFKTGKNIKGQLSCANEEGGQEFAYTLIPIMDIRGRVVNVVAYLNDISTDREKDRMLKMQSLELNRSNQELEQFAKIASNDLNEPLRQVQSYLKLLHETLGEGMPGDARKYLNYALDGADRMQALINDLLEYSRVGAGHDPFKQLKVNELVISAERDLKRRVDNTNAIISAEKLPAVWGMEGQLRQLLVHLISNGLKYNKNSKPEIKVSAEQRNDKWVFEVRDNGIGIASKDCERIFQIFQRVHSRAEYSGTGVGLAICRKIVSRHKGEIWVKSKPRKGSSFFFSLPIRHKGNHQLTIDLFEESG